jgi:hypothetical protein
VENYTPQFQKAAVEYVLEKTRKESIESARTTSPGYSLRHDSERLHHFDLSSYAQQCIQTSPIISAILTNIATPPSTTTSSNTNASQSPKYNEDSRQLITVVALSMLNKARNEKCSGMALIHSLCMVANGSQKDVS